MENWIIETVSPLPLWGLLLVIAFFIGTLSKGADMLVEEAVTLSIRWGVPTLLIGATIVSLGTTLPETAVSVMAAMQGRPELALGNAVGSIICDTGLILGLALVIKPIEMDLRVVNRQGYIQLGAGFLLVGMSMPWSNLGGMFSAGGRLPQWGGWIFMVLLVLYIWKTIQWSRKDGSELEDEIHEDRAANWLVALKLVAGISLVILSSKFLIPTVEVTAERLAIPKSIIAATLVAFGTSLPELVTVLTAVRKGHGSLALGNVIGADILNVLFVAGMAASVTAGGLVAEPRFFQMLFPGMLGILLIFRTAVWISGKTLGRLAGVALLGAYVLITVLSMVTIGSMAH